MARSSREVVEKTKMRVLELVVQSGQEAGGGSVRLSIDNIAEALDLSIARIRLARRKLVEEGLLAERECYAKNGGRLENAYRATAAGKRKLSEYKSTP